MKKSRIIPIAAALLIAAGMSGCKKDVPVEAPGASSPESVTEEGTKEASPESTQDTKEAAKEETKETLPEETKNDEPIPFVPTAVRFCDRVNCGNKNAFFIEDDNTFTRILSCYENETIAFSGGDDKYYFNLVNVFDEKPKYELYFWVDEADMGSTPLDPVVPEGMYVSSTAVWDHKFYFSFYNSETGKYPIYFYDPEGDAFVEDERLENMSVFLSTYRGMSLSALCSNMLEDLMRSSHIYMQDGESGIIYVFDKDGVEEASFDPVVKNSSYDCYGDNLLVGKNTEMDENYNPDTTYTILYDTFTGKSTELFRSPGYGEEEIVDVRDGYIYYFKENKTEYKAIESRDYYRMNLDEAFSGKRNEQFICSVPAYPRVESIVTGFGSRNSCNGFNIKDNRAYYLDFFPDDSEGYRGDVMWCYTDIGTDGKREITDCLERHESFADWGYIERHGECKEVDGVKYFTAEYQDFRFHDEVKNSDKLNKELEEIDEMLNSRGPEMAENAEQEFKEFYSDGGFPGYGYSYEKTFGDIKEIAPSYVNVSYDNYEYYGGAHGMPGIYNYLFSIDEGKRLELQDLYKGTEEEFRKIVVDASIESWKSGNGYFYDDYSPGKVSEMRETFAENVNFGMNMEFMEDKLAVYYQPYSVGPFASGFIEIDVPYSKLGIKL